MDYRKLLEIYAPEYWPALAESGGCDLIGFGFLLLAWLAS